MNLKELGIVNMTQIRMKFSLLLNFLLSVAIKHCVADDHGVEYKTKTATHFEESLSPHYNCYVISGASGLLHCIPHCVNWMGKRCLGFAYDNVSCWVCNYSPVPYEVSPTLVVTKAEMFWMSDGRQRLSVTFCHTNVPWFLLTKLYVFHCDTHQLQIIRHKL